MHAPPGGKYVTTRRGHYCLLQEGPPAAPPDETGAPHSGTVGPPGTVTGAPPRETAGPRETVGGGPRGMAAAPRTDMGGRRGAITVTGTTEDRPEDPPIGHRLQVEYYRRPMRDECLFFWMNEFLNMSCLKI